MGRSRMCGIVGLYLKDAKLEPQLGALTASMLATMCERGPDSAGFAVYSTAVEGELKFTLQSANPSTDFPALATLLEAELGGPVRIDARSTHAVVHVKADALDRLKALVLKQFPSVRIMGIGEAIEIYKEVGLPTAVSSLFALSEMSGSHAIGHTRMATESAVTTSGAHPFSTGLDQCLVHNGSLSNHNNLRRALRQQGYNFQTDNDSEVAAGYLSWRMREGRNLKQALEKSLDDLDGFFTFVVGTKTGFAVLRDPIACKPAVLAETASYVAFGSEYRALAGLPGIDTAKIWEPEPATAYFWGR